MRKQCQHCGLAFETKRQHSKFCSNACRTSAHRKLKGMPEPSFLAQSKPSNASNLSGLGNSLPRLGRAVRLLKVLNPAWSQVQSELARLEAERDRLLVRREEIVRHYNSIINQNESLKGYFAVGLAGAAASGEKDPVGRVFLAGGAGLLGYALAGALENLTEDKNVKNRKKNELIAIEKEVEIIDKKIFNIDTAIYINKKEMKNINQYIEQKEEIRQVIVNEKQTNNTKNKIKIMATDDISGMEFETFSFENEWNTLFGEPEHGFSMAIYGKPGAGKSTFALQFAHYLAENKGKVLFVSSEEGISKSIRDKINRLNLKSKGLNIVSECNDENKLTELLNTYKFPFVFLDSVNHMKITVEEMEQIKKRFPKVTFVLIFQATKAGEMKGSLEYAHNCDIKLRIENQTATTEKNRYADLTALPLSINPSLLEPSIKSNPTTPE